MLQHMRDSAAELVLRYPFTIGAVLFGLAMLLAVRPALMSTAGSAPPTPRATAASAPSPAIPPLLWTRRPLSGAPDLSEATAAASARKNPVAFEAISPTDALTQWSATLSLVAALTERPSQAAHDLAREVATR